MPRCFSPGHPFIGANGLPALAAISAASASATVSSTTATAILRLGLIYFKSSSVDLLAVKFCDRVLSFRIRWHLNESKSPRPARFAVLNYVG